MLKIHHHISKFPTLCQFTIHSSKKPVLKTAKLSYIPTLGKKKHTKLKKNQNDQSLCQI